jgi:hypothetical protein
MPRDLRLDTLRGLLLVLITINHFGSWSSEGWWVLHFTWQPLGYVSAAEGFVFLSGFFVALVYSRHAQQPALLWQMARQRALDIYSYHLAMTLSLAAIFLTVPFYQSLWGDWLRPYHLTPTTSTLASILLLHQPPYLDILPMYTVLMLLSPIAVLMLHRHKAAPLLAASLFLWLVGQSFHLGELFTGLLFPGHQSGHFNLLSWQLLFILGLVLGDRYGKKELFPPLTNQLLVGVIFFCTLGFFLSRHALIFPEIRDGIDRAALGWLRVVNFLLLVASTGAVLQRFPSHAHVPWLTFLGQHSLPVFSFHVVALYLLTPVTSHIADTFGSFGLLVLMLLMVYCLRFPAFLHLRYKTWAAHVGKYAYSSG